MELIKIKKKFRTEINKNLLSLKRAVKGRDGESCQSINYAFMNRIIIGSTWLWYSADWNHRSMCVLDIAYLLKFSAAWTAYVLPISQSLPNLHHNDTPGSVSSHNHNYLLLRDNHLMFKLSTGTWAMHKETWALIMRYVKSQHYKKHSHTFLWISDR